MAKESGFSNPLNEWAEEEQADDWALRHPIGKASARHSRFADWKVRAPLCFAPPKDLFEQGLTRLPSGSRSINNCMRIVSICLATDIPQLYQFVVSNVTSDPTPIPGIILSDSVIREEGSGKLSLIGTFSFFNTTGFPFRTPPFFITALFTNIEGIGKAATVTIRIEEKTSGHVVWSSAAELKFNRPPTRDNIIELPFSVPDCHLPKAGTYSVVLLINNEKIAARDLPVRNVTATPLQNSDPNREE